MRKTIASTHLLSDIVIIILNSGCTIFNLVYNDNSESFTIYYM